AMLLFAHRRFLACSSAAAMLLALPLLGCKKPQPALPELTSASEVLERMVAAYHEATSYQDSGQVRLHFKKLNDAKQPAVNQEWDYSIAFLRPNQLRLHVYQAMVVCDGKKLHGALNLDEVRGQVLEVAAPTKLAAQQIFETDPFLGQVLTQGGAAGPPLILPLLLEEAALDPVLEGAEKPTLLPPEKADGEICYRVEAKRADGRLVFWIDQKNFALRRIEYPTDEFAKGVEEKEGRIADLSLTVEFTGAKLNADIEPEAFKFESPDDARLVDQFMVPPPLLGERIADFKFRGLDGQAVTRDSLSGKVAVIDFWATWCEPCLKSLPNLQQVAERYADSEKIVFLAVSVDNDEVTDDAVRQTFADAKLSLPIARDPDIAARRAFLVESLPTMVIVGPNGVVQDYENVFDPDLAESLPPKLDKLLAGQDIFEETLRQFAAPATSGTADAQVTAAEIAPRSEPAHLSMSSLWSCRDLKSPGNVLAIDEGDGRLLVLDNWQTVVEIDGEGQPLAQHRLDLPAQAEEAVVSFLRTVVDRRGRRWFAGSANGVQQLFVFDANWKRRLTIPTKAAHPGITDAQFGDLDGDGEPEIHVGFWGQAGVQSVSLDGTQRWTNKSCENVLKLALLTPGSGGQAELLATTAQGNIVPIDTQGREHKPLGAGKRFIQLVYAADLDGDGASEICAIGPSQKGGGMRPGDNAAFGLSASGDVLWQYDLPPGVPNNGALEYVASGNLIGDAGQWVIAGPDGSIHILSADGRVVDRFNSGLALAGLAVAQLKGQSALILTSSEGVEAKQFEQTE
ncbi:MAG TPA: thioredoxin-like domain-containing protein, partial [Pirellulales bacterium]|nr:thioredoxin-like domain-containing protein [Pirellulales bacterium]